MFLATGSQNVLFFGLIDNSPGVFAAHCHGHVSIEKPINVNGI